MWVAAALGSTLIVVAALALPRRRRRHGRHVRERDGRRERHVAAASSVSGDDRPEVADLEDVELATSPQTGALTPAPAPVPVPEDRDPQATVAARVAVTGEADPGVSLAPLDTIPDAVQTPPTLPVSPAPDDARRAEMLAAAWQACDVEALAAQAEMDPGSRLSAFVLAADLGARLGDPRVGHWLFRAHMTGQDPAADELLTPYRPSLSFAVDVPAWGLSHAWPCTREGLMLTVAAHELVNGDPDSAYAALRDAPPTTAGLALRALAAVEMGWWERALRAEPPAPDEIWAAVWACSYARALAADGRPAPACAHLDAVVDAAKQAPWAAVWSRAVYARAACRRDLGDTDGAWADLRDLLSVDPTFPGAAQALKAL